MSGKLNENISIDNSSILDKGILNGILGKVTIPKFSDINILFNYNSEQFKKFMKDVVIDMNNSGLGVNDLLLSLGKSKTLDKIPFLTTLFLYLDKTVPKVQLYNDARKNIIKHTALHKPQDGFLLFSLKNGSPVLLGLIFEYSLNTVSRLNDELLKSDFILDNYGKIEFNTDIRGRILDISFINLDSVTKELLISSTSALPGLTHILGKAFKVKQQIGDTFITITVS